MIRPVTVLNMTQNCHNHEKGKVFYAPKKTKPLPTGIGCHSLHTQGEKKNQHSIRPACPRPIPQAQSPGKAVCLCFPGCGQLAWPGARGEERLRKKIPQGAEPPCRLEAARGWAQAPAETPQSPQSSGNKGPAAEVASWPAFFTELLPGIRAAFLPPRPIQRHDLTHGPWCF